MPRQPIQAEYTSFVAGLITEASPFTYPENASLEEVNFVLDRDGSRKRRFGIDYEVGAALIETGVDVNNPKMALSSFTWSSVANKGSLEFAVVQVGNDLYFFFSNRGAISDNPANGGVKITIAGNPQNIMSMTSLYGKLIVVHGTQEVHTLVYTEATDTISVTSARLQVRDLFGVEDNLETGTRPVDLTLEHQYNLRNQGWLTSFPCTNNFTSSSPQDPIAFTKTNISVYPSNADILWAGKLASATEPAAVGAYNPSELRKVVFGSTQAPRGHYVIDVFNRGQNRGLVDKADASTGGIVAVAAYAGRAFYAIKETSRSQVDSRSPNIGTMIFFSMAEDNIKSLVKCFSEADPTSEHVSDPVATDGGFVTIPESGEVLQLVAMGQSLFVFCTNGVWEIHGGEDSFSALNQNIAKTTDVGASSGRSIVYAEDKIAYWGLTGIYLITRNDLTLRGGNNDLTVATIQSLFDDIDLATKRESVGVYDPFIRTFRWLYRDASLPNSSFFNKELVYDTTLGAFYIFNIDVPDYDYPFIAGFISMDSVLFTTAEAQVVSEELPDVNYDVEVIDDKVKVKELVTDSTYKGAVKYLTVLKTGETHKFTFSHYYNTQFRDWQSYDGVGVDAPASMLTGYINGGTSMLEKSLDYLHVYCKRTEVGTTELGELIDPSSVLVQVQWEWTNSSNAGRWSRPVEAYRLPRIFLVGNNPGVFNYGYTTVITKNRIRGRGRAMSILFKTKPYHNCHIYGWGVDGSAGVA